MIFLICCLLGCNLAEGKDYMAPRGTTYFRQNIHGGHDYYNRQGKIGWNRKAGKEDKYYNRNGMYMRSNDRRIYISPNVKWLD